MSVITVVVWVAACGGVILRPQGHIVLESYPTNARCEWTVQVEVERTVELRWVTFPPSSVEKKGKKQNKTKKKSTLEETQAICSDDPDLK